MGILFQTSIDFNIIYEIMILYESFRKLKAKLFVFVSYCFFLFLVVIGCSFKISSLKQVHTP